MVGDILASLHMRIFSSAINKPIKVNLMITITISKFNSERRRPHKSTSLATKQSGGKNNSVRRKGVENPPDIVLTFLPTHSVKKVVANLAISVALLMPRT